MPVRSPERSLSVIAWGDPVHPRTFSGYSSKLVSALEADSVGVRCFSAKSVRMMDAFRGALRIQRRRSLPSLEVSRSWMWSERGNQTLETRMANSLRNAGARGPFLQVGTLVDVPRSLGPHYVLTDMTIAQAHSAGHFSISRLGSGTLEEAVDVQRRIIENAAHVFVLSNWTRDAVLNEFDLPDERITTVYAGANLDFSDCTRSGPRRREILFVGIDWARKGGPLLLDAFSLVRQAIPDATLRIIGCTPDVSQPGVFVEGFLDRRDPEQFDRLKDCYLRASCFCLPSLFDPFPNAILEASAAGLATVAIDNGSRREAVVDGITGCLVSKPKADELADTLVSVLSDRRRASEMGAAARSLCERDFTWQSVVSKITGVVFHHDQCLHS